MGLTAKERSRIQWHARVRELSPDMRAAYLALMEAAPLGGELTIALAADVFSVLASEPRTVLTVLGRAGLLLPTTDGVLVIHPDIATGAEVFA